MYFDILLRLDPEVQLQTPLVPFSRRRVFAFVPLRVDDRGSSAARAVRLLPQDHNNQRVPPNRGADPTPFSMLTPSTPRLNSALQWRT